MHNIIKPSNDNYIDSTGIVHNKQLLSDVLNKRIYSTEEKIVGIWINNKPLYQKIISITTPSTSTNGAWPDTNRYDICNNIELVIIDKVVVKASSTEFMPNHHTTRAGYGIKIYYYMNKLCVDNNATSYNNLNGYVVVLYTKTTD